MPEKQELLWELYEKLPEELKEAIFSEKTALAVWDICEKNEVEETDVVAKYVGQVLMGLLLPEDFAGVLEKELKLKKEAAGAMAQEINRLVFYPVKECLTAFRQGEQTGPAAIEEQEKEEEKTAYEKRRDSYREPIE